MYTPEFKNILTSTLDGLRAEGLYKEERFIASQQYSQVTLKDGRSVINMCANNYLGLANNPEVMEAAKKAIDQWGFGMASVRFICGTQTLHRQLEERLTQFLGTEDTILFPSCFDANGGLFEGLLTADDAIISDSLNHASIIDGVRLCKAKRFRYANNDMADLEAKLQEADAAGARVKLISTDGVFSMDGIIAQLDKIHELAAKYNAIVHFDDCHATGFLGEKGRGTHEYRGLFGHIDITTGTLGKALGGASGGYVSGPKEVVDVLRQKARPYLFSNSVAPAIVAASIKVLDLLEQSTEARDRVEANTKYFRDAMISAFINKAAERKYPWQPKPRIVVCIPCGATSVEKRAVFEATIQAGARQAYLIEEPMAAAMGADLPVTEPTGSMVVDIGGGTTEVAVISLGGIVTSSSLRLAGNRLDEAIAMHLRDLLGIKIGERTAEVIKIKIGSILPFEDGRERDMIISGQDVYTEQPKEVTIQSEDVRAALQAPIEEMVLHIKDTFKKTNPDLASDIIQNGILLTGGGGLLSGLDRYLTDKLEIPVWVSETALTNVVSGCLKVLETPTALKQTLMRSK